MLRFTGVHSQKTKTNVEMLMTLKIDNQGGPNVFPLVEGIDVRDAGKSSIAVDLAGCSGAR